MVVELNCEWEMCSLISSQSECNLFDDGHIAPIWRGYQTRNHNLVSIARALELARPAFAGPGPNRRSEANTGCSSRRKPAEKGADLYMKYCGLSHGKSGEGYLEYDASALAHQPISFLKP
jgi:hypothetical protein